MMRRALLIAGALFIVFAVPASAQTYGSPGITTSAPLVPGSTVIVSACCYVPGTIVTFNLRSNLSGTAAAKEFNGVYVAALHGQATQTYTATAGPDGVASVTITVPANAVPGSATLSAAGTPIPGTGTPANNAIDVTIGSASGGGAGTGSLPVTGTDSALPLSLIAVVLLASGGAALLISRRRDTHQADGNGGSPAA